MIKIHYTDELGDVEVSFDSLDDYNKFKEELVSKAEAAKEAEAEKRRKEEQERAKQFEARWNELKHAARAFVSRAKEYGVPPLGVLEILRSSIRDLASDRPDEPQQDKEDEGNAE